MRGAQTREIWQFNAGGKFTLQRKESKLPSEPLPVKMVRKDWQSIVQPRLNVAWLPPDKVFIRSVQLPKADEAETRSMVELQLEKISPVPAAQLVWSFEVVPFRQQAAAGQNLSPHGTGELQTVVVIMVGRELVEQYLGELEGQGFQIGRAHV